MNLHAAFTTFVAQSTELLQQMEDALLQFDHLSCDAEAVNAIFPGAHTIKGSARLFGLYEIGFRSEAVKATDKAIWNLIFEPGFSTADQDSNLSGRGVGMDVVRRNITALRGSVNIDTEEGIGTAVRIRLPLTLAIIDGFHVAVGNASFVLPLDMVVECLEMSAEDRKAANERNYISLRGQVLPYLNLRAMFSVEGDPARRENLVVVQHGGMRVGLVVDYLLGEIQTVIKTREKLFSQVNGIAGSTIVGNGQVALILDVPALIRQSYSVEEKQIAGAREIVSEALEH